jgi:hypothetical protein
VHWLHGDVWQNIDKAKAHSVRRLLLDSMWRDILALGDLLTRLSGCDTVCPCLTHEDAKPYIPLTGLQHQRIQAALLASSPSNFVAGLPICGNKLSP